eukprot:1157454-Pelagomonas_calceolata.AAC.11
MAAEFWAVSGYVKRAKLANVLHLMTAEWTLCGCLPALLPAAYINQHMVVDQKDLRWHVWLQVPTAAATASALHALIGMCTKNKWWKSGRALCAGTLRYDCFQGFCAGERGGHALQTMCMRWDPEGWWHEPCFVRRGKGEKGGSMNGKLKVHAAHEA